MDVSLCRSWIPCQYPAPKLPEFRAVYLVALAQAWMLALLTPLGHYSDPVVFPMAILQLEASAHACVRLRGFLLSFQFLDRGLLRPLGFF